MSSQDKSFERINQKRRTRSELLRAAQELTGRGLQPSVAEVADHAGISRATAYRYFSTPDDMIREAVLDAVATSIAPLPELPEGTDKDPEVQLLALVRQVFDMVEANEPMFRALLASTATGKAKTKRGGRRIGWLTEVLEPLRKKMPPKAFDKLLASLALLTGIETMVVLKDVCLLDGAEAAEVTLWAARTLLNGAIAEASADC